VAEGLGIAYYQVNEPVVDLSGGTAAPVAVEIALAGLINGTVRAGQSHPEDFVVVLLDSDFAFDKRSSVMRRLLAICALAGAAAAQTTTASASISSVVRGTASGQPLADFSVTTVVCGGFRNPRLVLFPWAADRRLRPVGTARRPRPIHQGQSHTAIGVCAMSRCAWGAPGKTAQVSLEPMSME
jgi:hypothetical protein